MLCMTVHTMQIIFPVYYTSALHIGSMHRLDSIYYNSTAIVALPGGLSGTWLIVVCAWNVVVGLEGGFILL